MSTYSQRRKIGKFKTITKLDDDKIAKNILVTCKWNVESAIDYYFTNEARYTKKVDKSKIVQIFKKYADAEEFNEITEFEQLNEDFGLSADWHPFALSFFFKTADMGVVTKNEFVGTFETTYKVDSLPKMKAAVQSIVKKLEDYNNSLTKEYYRWIYDFFKEDDRKTIDKDDAVDLWKCILHNLPRGWKLATWIDFIEAQTKLRTINKDLWEMLFDFFLEFEPDCSNWEDDGCWPSVLDEFVESIQS